MQPITADVTIAAIRERLARTDNYALDMDFSRQFAFLVQRAETSVLYMVRALSDRARKDMEGRDKYARSIRYACESIWTWYNAATEYREVSTNVALDMLESHDPACLWAVMLGQKARTL